ncbi:MAG: YihY/virulence factor BrkB family protein [Pseudomonadota bacterium]|nr:YihY/virulence factor BrkB family protein [Pseudomonadota bacterium]
MNSIAQIPGRIDQLLWHTDLDRAPKWQRSAVHFARLVYAIVRDLTQGYLTLQAMSLVYTTLLSLVPLLAVSFSVLKGFGVHNQIEPMLLNALAPLGEQGVEITQRIIGFVDNMKVGVLGSVGLALLIYTVVSLIQKIEQVFNYTWRVEKSRSLIQRFSQYLSVLLIGPVLFFSAVGLTASITNTTFVQKLMAVQPLGLLVEYAGELIPYLLITGAFAFVYVFVPNTRVRFGSALVGALVAGALWQTVGWVFATFMAGSTKYAAIYSSLAILILFMIWIYLAWLILLIGASIAFYHQHPEYLATRTRELHLSNRLKEHLAFSLVGRIAASHYGDGSAWSNQALSTSLKVPNSTVECILGIVESGGFIVRTAADPPLYVMSRAPESIPLKSFLDYVRCYEEDELGCRERETDPLAAKLENLVDKAMTTALDGRTLRDLAAVRSGRGSTGEESNASAPAPVTDAGPQEPERKEDAAA